VGRKELFKRKEKEEVIRKYVLTWGVLMMRIRLCMLGGSEGLDGRTIASKYCVAMRR